jgi:nucleoside-diphosphate-sugar epimerase
MKRVLVTGATGFIGGRCMELLNVSSDFQPVAGVRSWKGCARLARTGSEMIRCDLADLESLEKAMAGAEAVIHCAMSDQESIVQGTRNVCEAAKRAGVRQVVYLSTGDVYSSPSGDLREAAPQLETRDWYSDAKRRAETVCEEFSSKGLNINMLRPGIVYGPFCFPWTQRIGIRLHGGKVGLLADLGNGICNAVFVDDVVEACVEFLRSSAPSGSAFNVNGPDRISWNDYFTAFAQALGVGVPQLGADSKATLKSRALEPIRRAAKFGVKHFEKSIMAIYTKNAVANALMKRLEATLKATPEAREMAVYAKKVYFDDSKLRNSYPNLLRTPLAQGMRHSANYMRVLGLVD